VFVGTLLLQSGCKRTPPETGQIEPGAPPPEILPQTNIFAPPIDLVPTAPESNIVVTPPTNEPPPPPPPPVYSTPEKEHTVAKGDSFYTLGRKYGVGYMAIVEANPGVDPTKLKIGQKVKIPSPRTKEGLPADNGTATSVPAAAKTYTVKSGDTLMKIAKTYGVTVKALRSVNNLKTDRIKVGDKLKIPAKSAAPAPVTPAGEPPAAAAPATPVGGAPFGTNI
jgi:LysM repeat protein